MKRTDVILYELLVEDQGYRESEFVSLNEDEKAYLLDGIVSSMINEIKMRMENSDTRIIDKTRGEVRRLPKIDIIINALDSIPATLASLNIPNSVIKEFEDFISVTTKCIHNIYNEVNIFKKAYKEKKVLLMIKYQTLINSFISSFTTLMAFVSELEEDSSYSNKIDFSPIIGHINNMKKFNDDISNGNWKSMLKDVKTLREEFVEVDADSLYESSSINLLIGAGLQALSKKISIGRMEIDARGLLYKLTGIVMLVLSVREVVYAMYNSKVKFGDTLKKAIDYAELQTGQEGLNQSQVNKRLSSLKKFTNKFLLDQEEAYTFAKRDIDNENRTIVDKEIDVMNSKVNDVEDKDSDDQQNDFWVGL
jgi:hypothetical protein